MIGGIAVRIAGEDVRGLDGRSDFRSCDIGWIEGDGGVEGPELQTAARRAEMRQAELHAATDAAGDIRAPVVALANVVGAAGSATAGAAAVTPAGM